ncbi:MAG TPA: hypothetical protein PLV72_02395 [Candidatus Magasanikbacteria bacterium]|nr:hypothetical protein [Candidatus Magasanikbacteria bacterium]
MTDRLAPLRSKILSPSHQIEAWLKANHGFAQNNKISKGAFKSVDSLLVPTLTPEDVEDGYLGAALFYGFGGNGTTSDMVLSAEVPWRYIASVRATWLTWVWEDEHSYRVCSNECTGVMWGDERFQQMQGSECFRFDPPKPLRPFSGRHSDRPVGFYWKLIRLGHAHQGESVEVVRQLIKPSDWGMGPEGIQFFLTHPYCAELMNGEDFPFTNLPDFEVFLGGAFSSAPCLCFGRGVGGLGLSGGGVSMSHPHSGSGSLR